MRVSAGGVKKVKAGVVAVGDEIAILAVLGPPVPFAESSAPDARRKKPGRISGTRMFWKSARKSTGPEATRRNDVGSREGGLGRTGRKTTWDCTRRGVLVAPTQGHELVDTVRGGRKGVSFVGQITDPGTKKGDAGPDRTGQDRTGPTGRRWRWKSAGAGNWEPDTLHLKVSVKPQPWDVLLTPMVTMGKLAGPRSSGFGLWTGGRACRPLSYQPEAQCEPP